eukprot:233190-Hanusia_phi.AAC.1
MSCTPQAGLILLVPGRANTSLKPSSDARQTQKNQNTLCSMPAMPLCGFGQRSTFMLDHLDTPVCGSTALGQRRKPLVVERVVVLACIHPMGLGLLALQGTAKTSEPRHSTFTSLHSATQE